MNFMNKKCKHKFDIKKTIWPFKEGYGVYCVKCRTILDTGLSKERAKQIAIEENRKL